MDIKKEFKTLSQVYNSVIEAVLGLKKTQENQHFLIED